MIGPILDGIIGAAFEAVTVLFMGREAERRWVNADRGDTRPTYAPPIVRHHQEWPGAGQAGAPAHQPWPHQQWPGGDR
jgi:hypothetical protein